MNVAAIRNCPKLLKSIKKVLTLLAQYIEDTNVHLLVHARGGWKVT